ncbi:Peptide-N4-(N-acetyl-beta-glucosaminyl)asparagine amidase A [Mycena sanguinolenta]|uniref:Peptide-N4-(N-acetyl-beta-glucosaminyl)asparagine amidase A n=1 Tax=Mycena sanguinolenta TaxID=230812 RepID=A0A8H6Y9E0_9AGAR|nr:Peptide-N4-(N-acetyl-beta-glucosaminyl)asparagine amidase A [Mycena sanguinolenta]
MMYPQNSTLHLRTRWRDSHNGTSGFAHDSYIRGLHHLTVLRATRPSGQRMLQSLWFFCALVFAAVFPQCAAVSFDFQVAQPPPVPQHAVQCTIQILQRDFANSYGKAEVVEFTPPTDCGTPGSWAAVTLNFTVTSNGTQYDRLGIFTFQNVEIWRTSTPEPTAAGIIWTYMKDVTRFIPLFAKPGTFILELDNIIEARLQLFATLHATFYASSPAHPLAKQANTIIPLSTLANNTGNEASVPPSFSINVTVPQNAVEIYAELIPSGNGNEEFWYLNTANEFLDEFPSGALGQGPFREVRLLVDGQVAGVAFPYPVIFTGGIVPPAWSPITSYGALDLPTYFLDLTPFVPLLTDGNPHTFTIDVASAEADKTILQNWFVSGALQVITDSSSKRTTGKITSYSAKPFAVASTTGRVDANGDLHITVTASRQINIAAEIFSGSGKRNTVVVSQTLEYVNQQDYVGNTLNLFQSSSGSVFSTHNNFPAVVDKFSYPITINYTALNDAGTQFTATFDHSYDRDLLPSPFILGSTIKERQLAGGFFDSNTGRGNGTSNNTFSYVDLAGNTYNRKVDAALNVITFDEVSGSLSEFPGLPPPLLGTKNAGAFAGARLPPGRGKLSG